MKEEKIKILYCEPHKKARIIEVDNKLESFQKLVGGYIEATYPYNDLVAIVCNEEGKFLPNCELNRALFAEQKKKYTYTDLRQKLCDIEKENEGLDEDEQLHQIAYVTFTEESMQKHFNDYFNDFNHFSEAERTFEFSSANKAFVPNMIGYSIMGVSLEDKYGANKKRPNIIRLEDFLDNGVLELEDCYTIEVSKTNEMVDILAGSFFICGLSENDFSSLSKPLQKKYLKIFETPETFVNINNRIIAIPEDDTVKPEKEKGKKNKKNIEER